MIITDKQSQAHSDRLKNQFREFDSFIESIDTLADFGCGQQGHDVDWWCSLTTRDEEPSPLNIRVTGVDIHDHCAAAHEHKNARYLKHDIEKPFDSSWKFDLVWCHNTLQYLENPYRALCNWRDTVDDGGALILSVPQNIRLFGRTRLYDQTSHCIHNFTVIQLIHILSLAGWESRGGYYSLDMEEGWITALVYNTNEPVRHPRNTSWYDLAETGLLPHSLELGIEKYGYAREQDLMLEWIDRSKAQVKKL